MGNHGNCTLSCMLQRRVRFCLPNMDHGGRTRCTIHMPISAGTCSTTTSLITPLTDQREYYFYIQSIINNFNRCVQPSKVMCRPYTPFKLLSKFGSVPDVIHSKLCLATATHIFKYVKFEFYSNLKLYFAVSA